MKKYITKTAFATLPTAYGTFQIHVYKSAQDGHEHAALRMGKNLKKRPMLVRVHSECLTGDTFWSLKCDCREQLHESMRRIQKAKRGILIYLNQEGRGIGLTNKIRAYKLQEQGLDTVEANQALHLPIDARDYRIAAEILHDLAVDNIALLTNNPEKLAQLKRYGINCIKRLPLATTPHAINKAYLLAKKKKLGHLITVEQ